MLRQSIMPIATVLMTAMLLLGGCSGNSLFPTAAEPDRTELSEWQQEELLKAALAALPRETSASLPAAYAPEIARFLSRALETAPDGEERRWTSADRTFGLRFRPTATAIAEDSICRKFNLELGLPDGKRIVTLRACRLKSGRWEAG